MGPDQVFGLHPNRTPCYPRSRTRRLILSYKAHVTLVEMIRRVQVVPVSDADTVLEQNRLQVHLLVYRDFKIDNRAVKDTLRATGPSGRFLVFRIRVHTGPSRVHGERSTGRSGDPKGARESVSSTDRPVTGDALAQGMTDGGKVSHEALVARANSRWNPASGVSNDELDPTAPFGHSHRDQPSLGGIGMLENIVSDLVERPLQTVEGGASNVCLA